ncbi:MAG: nidogen-like domain-containing protein [Bacteroidota bacterium]
MRPIHKAIIGICGLLGGGICSFLQAQCPIESVDTLVFLDFEQALPPEWEALPTTDGGAWQQDAGTIGFFENPGRGNWLYVNDEAENTIGEAFFLSPPLETADYQGALELSFLLNFQRFADTGTMTLLLKAGEAWETLHHLEEDFKGRIQVDLSPYAGKSFQLGWQYDDGGNWNWGMGLDDIVLTGRPVSCANGVCGYGEFPQNCPTDCPLPPDQAPFWIPHGEDLYGESVEYRSFLGGSTCDDCSEKIELGFSVSAWGESREDIWLNSNGNISFEAEYLVFTPEGFCLEGPNFIAPFFADADLRGGGSISYYQDPERHYLIVHWDRLRYYGCEGVECEQTNSFQLLLTDGSISQIGGQPLSPMTNVIFNFGQMTWTTGTSSNGTLGFGGSPATVGINAGDGTQCHDYGTFDRPGYPYYGNQQDLQCPPNGVQHLNGKSLQFQTETGQMVPQSTFASIQGSYQEAGHLVRWTISPGIAIDWFMIERSSDSLIFEEVATISPEEAIAPDSAFLQFLDGSPLPHTSHYRVSSISPLGEMDTSDVVSIEAPRIGSPIPAQRQLYALHVGPNPFERDIRFRFTPSPEGAATYVLTDLGGKVLLQGQVSLSREEAWHSLTLPELPPALYVFRLSYRGQNYGKRLLRK